MPNVGNDEIFTEKEGVVMCIKGYDDYVNLGVYGVYGWVLDFKNRGVSNRTVSDLLKYDDGPMGQYNEGITTLIASRNCVVYSGWRNTRRGRYEGDPEYYIRAYFYGMFSMRFVPRKILQVVGATAKKEKGFKNNKVVLLKVSYVDCKGLADVTFEFDVSKVKLKA